jgi:hypothetical protein
VVYDFIRYSGLPRVSSRDLGRYLKQLSVGGTGGITLLDTMKRYYGGMYQYLSSMGCYDCELPSFTHSTTDHSYWISLTQTPVNGDDHYVAGVDNFRLDEPFAGASLTETEKHFLSSYSVERLINDRQTLYLQSLERMLILAQGEPDPIPDARQRHDVEKMSSVQRVYEATGNVDVVDGTLELPSQLSDYSGMTLVELKEVCREKGLAVSGTKAALVSRIENCLHSERSSRQPSRDISKHSKELVSLPPHRKDDHVAEYLKELVLEYLHAKGGVANSRMIGRYLAANKASPKNQQQVNNALKEMKSIYGNLNTFVAKFPDDFISFRDNRNNNNNSIDESTSSSGGSDSFGFSIALKNREKDRA